MIEAEEQLLPDEELEDGSGIMGLPGKFASWRPHQAEMMTDIVQNFVSGKRYVIAEFPTGSGKTMISMAARQILDTKTIYICTTKSLQDQFLADFPHAKLIKGRGNYPCGESKLAAKFPDITAEDCPRSKCLLSCPYMSAKQAAIRAPLTVMNMAYFLAEIQHGGAFVDRGLIVIDEADTLEDALLDQVSVVISMSDVDNLALGQPEFVTKFESWKAWAEQAIKKIHNEVKVVKNEINTKMDKEDWDTLPVALVRRKRRLDRMGAKLGFFLKHVDEYWVWERKAGMGFNVSGKPYADQWIFKPVRVDEFGDIIFTAADKFILMSATILDFFQYERNVGLTKYRDDGLVAGLKLGSVFDPARRPVRVVEGIDLTYKNKEAGMRLLPNAVKKILDQHPNEKGLIHAVTYDIAKALQKSFPERVVTHSPASRREVIEKFKHSTDPLVLVSPSADRGEDFPDDVCRFIIIVKIPYPYLGDERIKRRLYHKDGQRWYTLKTVSKLVQMTGRGMRHEGDSCTSYILDSGFRQLFMSNRSMFPAWWKEALIWESLNTGKRRVAVKGVAKGGGAWV